MPVFLEHEQSRHSECFQVERGEPAARDLPTPAQRFVGGGRLLGAAAVDRSGPVPASGNRTDGACAAGLASPLGLRLDEGVRLGAGGFTLEEPEGSAIPVSVSVAFDTVTLTPSPPRTVGSLHSLEAQAGVRVDHAGQPWAGLAAGALDLTTGGTASPTAC